MTASYFGENVEDLAEIFGKEVAAEMCAEAGDDTSDAVESAEESIVVTGTGDDDVGGVGY